jgi:hypothetical protein
MVKSTSMSLWRSTPRKQMCGGVSSPRQYASLQPQQADDREDAQPAGVILLRAHRTDMRLACAQTKAIIMMRCAPYSALLQIF